MCPLIVKEISERLATLKADRALLARTTPGTWSAARLHESMEAEMRAIRRAMARSVPPVPAEMPKEAA